MLYTKYYLEESIAASNAMIISTETDNRSVEGYYNEWWMELAPLPKLTNALEKGGLSWQQYADQYRKFLRYPSVSPKLLELSVLALKETVTVIGLKVDPDYCHRKILAMEAQLILPELEINIK